MNAIQLDEEAIYHLARRIEVPGERDAYLRRACGGDAALLGRLDALLRVCEQEASFLESSPYDATVDVPAGDATAATPAGCERPGSVIGPYKLLEQIGEGGMGVVYMAEQAQPVRRKVALKIIKPGMDSRQVIARFEAERQALALMDHPNIAKVLDAGSTDSGRPYFVMELIKGVPITDYCDVEHLGLDDRLDLFVLVCQAVQHAHQKGIIHRDIKPTNVLITLHDGVPVPKVIDFGIAKATGGGLTDKTLFTAFAQLIGTPLYMSPEQAGMSGIDVDTRSDIYSLGVLLYELLTGSTPFDGATFRAAALGEIQRIIREDEPPRPSTRLSTLAAMSPAVAGTRPSDARKRGHAVRGELDWIVMKALEKDRTRRYGTASDFAADVMRHLSDRPVEACPPSAWYRFSKSARRHRAALTTAALVAAALLIGTGVSAWQAVRATQAESQANANEAQARSAVGAERSAKQAEAKQRRRAESSERRANERLVEVERQQKQSEKNLEAALEAVDRMLGHVEDSELNDVPRVGPLRRKILKDAIAFYERIPLQSEISEEVRYRVARTWNCIGHISYVLDDFGPAGQAFNTAVATLKSLVAEQPGQSKYRANLARFQFEAGYFYIRQQPGSEQAEKLFRRSSELYAELANDNSAEKSWLIKQAESLGYLSEALDNLGKREEAIGSARRALDLLDFSQEASGFDRAQILYGLAQLSRSTPEQADDLFRRALVEYRNYFSSAKDPGSKRTVFAANLRRIACRGDFLTRSSDEAEKLLDESITLWREICGPSLSRRDDSFDFMLSLLEQARHQRRRAAGQAGNEDRDQVADRLTKSETLFQEAISRQRQSVSMFALPADRFILVQILQEESEYLVGRVGTPNSEYDAARRLQADALLTEAIQLGRQLVAEFPKDSTHGDRLAAMLRLQAEHFGQKDGAKRPEAPLTPDP